MSTVTIVPSDGIVAIDGKAFVVDCSSVDSSIHAVQWNGTAGEIEFVTVNGQRAPNEVITDISPFQAVIDLWNAKNSAPPPPPPVPAKPTTLSRRQLLMVLMNHNFITVDEAVAAAGTGAIPAIVASYINSLPADQQPVAKITWAAVTVAHRTDPMLNALAVANNVTPDQLDAFFVEGQSL